MSKTRNEVTTAITTLAYNAHTARHSAKSEQGLAFIYVVEEVVTSTSTCELRSSDQHSSCEDVCQGYEERHKYRTSSVELTVLSPLLVVIRTRRRSMMMDVGSACQACRCDKMGTRDWLDRGTGFLISLVSAGMALGPL